MLMQDVAVERPANRQNVATVLVVDDNELFRQACCSMLQALDFTVLQAQNGAEALETTRQHNCDVIVLDLAMPQMDGLELLRRLRQEGNEVSVIVVTGYGDVDKAVETMKLGAVDFVEKPFRLNDLVSRIEAVLDERSPEPDLETALDPLPAPAPTADPVIAYIQENAVRVRSRKDVAQALELSVDQVSARVQEKTRMSFRHFLHTCRLRQATRLLAETPLSISQVAERTGFATVQHFCRIFGHRMGLSPRKYRQQCRQRP